MRIIAGALRGKKLAKVPTSLIRPTSDRLRESIFNILGKAVVDAVVLDLFAGTGAMGIEALSRGADECVFVDNARPAVRTIRANLSHTKLSDLAIVRHGRAKCGGMEDLLPGTGRAIRR